MEVYEINPPDDGSSTVETIESKLCVATRPVPTLSSDQVLVKIKAVTLNYRDLIVLKDGGNTYGIPIKNGLIPCGEAAGIVEQSTTPKWKKDDRVVVILDVSWDEDHTVAAFDVKNTMGAGSVDGTLAQYVAVSASNVMRVPSHLSFEEAAALPIAYGTAWNALFYGSEPLQNGDWYWWREQGLAKALGAKIFAISSTGQKLRLLEDMGATATVSYKEHSDWDQKAMDATNGKGVDQVIDVAGSSTILQALRATKPGGNVSVIGFLSESKPLDLIADIVLGAKNVRGVLFASVPMMRDMFRFIEEKQIRPKIAKTFAWQEARDAFKLLVDQDFVGKIAVRVD